MSYLAISFGHWAQWPHLAANQANVAKSLTSRGRLNLFSIALVRCRHRFVSSTSSCAASTAVSTPSATPRLAVVAGPRFFSGEATCFTAATISDAGAQGDRISNSYSENATRTPWRRAYGSHSNAARSSATRRRAHAVATRLACVNRPRRALGGPKPTTRTFPSCWWATRSNASINSARRLRPRAIATAQTTSPSASQQASGFGAWLPFERIAHLHGAAA